MHVWLITKDVLQVPMVIYLLKLSKQDTCLSICKLYSYNCHDAFLLPIKFVFDRLMCRFHIVPDHKFLSALKTCKRNIPYYVETSQLFCRALANRQTGMMENVIVKSVNILKSEAEFFFFSFFSVYYILSFKNPEKLLPSTIFNPLTHDVYKKVKHT